MTDRAIVVQVRVRQGEGPQMVCELRLGDPHVIDGIIERAAGRNGGRGWDDAMQLSLMAVQNVLMEWAQREHPGPVQAARNPADVLALMLGRPWRCPTCDDPACCGHPPHPLDSGDSGS